MIGEKIKKIISDVICQVAAVEGKESNQRRTNHRDPDPQLSQANDCEASFVTSQGRAVDCIVLAANAFLALSSVTNQLAQPPQRRQRKYTRESG